LSLSLSDRYGEVLVQTWEVCSVVIKISRPVTWSFKDFFRQKLTLSFRIRQP